MRKYDGNPNTYRASILVKECYKCGEKLFYKLTTWLFAEIRSASFVRQFIKILF